MQVLVTGATGFIGQAVLQQLRGQGHTVRAQVRDPASGRARRIAERFQAELVAGDVLEPQSLPTAVQGADAVIHLVGIISEVGRNTFQAAHVEATRNVLGAARQTGVRRFVHMSALGTRPNAVSRYHQTKWAAEELVRQSGLDWTILRPSIVYGPEDQFTNLFARMARWTPIMPVMGSGRSKLQPIAVADVARAFARALDKPESIGQTFALCGEEVFTFVELLDCILEASGRKRAKLHVPLPLARLQAAVLERVFPRLLGRPSPLTRDQLLMLEEDNIGDPLPAKERFGLELHSFAEGLKAMLFYDSRGR